jgi:hypothetical protein
MPGRREPDPIVVPNTLWTSPRHDAYATGVASEHLHLGDLEGPDGALADTADADAATARQGTPRPLAGPGGRANRPGGRVMSCAVVTRRVRAPNPRSRFGRATSSTGDAPVPHLVGTGFGAVRCAARSGAIGAACPPPVTVHTGWWTARAIDGQIRGRAAGQAG